MTTIQEIIVKPACLLLIQSNDILQKIRSNDVSWKACVPEKVVTIITERALFYTEEEPNP